MIKTLHNLSDKVNTKETLSLHHRVSELLLDYYMLMLIWAWRGPDKVLVNVNYPDWEEVFNRLLEDIKR